MPCLLYHPIYQKNQQIIIPFGDKTWDFPGVYIYLTSVKTQHMKPLCIIIRVKSNIVGTPSQIFALGICRSYLSWEFAAAVCWENLPWLFAMGWLCICEQNFFCESKSFFIVNKPFLYDSKTFFVYGNFFINSVSFCYCRGSNGPLYILLMEFFPLLI